MSGWGFSATSRTFCIDGKCPKCGETLDVLSDTDEEIRYQCTTCDLKYARQKEEVVD